MQEKLGGKKERTLLRGATNTSVCPTHVHTHTHAPSFPFDGAGFSFYIFSLLNVDASELHGGNFLVRQILWGFPWWFAIVVVDD